MSRTASCLRDFVVNLFSSELPTQTQVVREIVFERAFGGGGIALVVNAELGEERFHELGADAGVRVQVVIAGVLEGGEIFQVVEQRDVLAELLVEVIR